MSDERITATRAEVTEWFFEDYLPRWVAMAAGTSADEPEFTHGYWVTAMYVTGLEQAFWCLNDESVRGFLELNHAPLHAAGYSHTVVPDRRVFVYNTVGRNRKPAVRSPRAISRLRACCVVHAPSGLVVVPSTWT
jgi:uncharacterized NTF2-like protein DUF6841